jgi:hypothetical protein
MNRVADRFGLHWRSTVRWDQTEAPVRSTAVVMIDEDFERVLKMPCVQHQQPVQTFGSYRSHEAVSIPFASGVCTGVRTTRTPCASNTASNDSDEPTPAAGSRPQTAEARQQIVAELFVAALRQKARALAVGRTRVGGRAGRVLAVVGSRLPPQDEMLVLGERIFDRAQVRLVIGSPRQFVMAAPAAYARFRSSALRDGRYFRAEAAESLRAGKISADEVDVLILTMLRNARRLLDAGRLNLSSPMEHDWLENIRREYLTQVFVDEAMDFSAV